MHKKIYVLCLLLLVCAAQARADTYSASEAGVHAISLTGSTSMTYTDASVTKTGDVAPSSDWTGSNAAVFASGKGKLTLTGSDTTITSDALGGNAVFSYGGNLKGKNSGDGTTITISDAAITTSKNNSGGIVVAGGGKIVAENLTVKTEGDSSAAISSGRGGGTITVTGGTYTTSGKGSPAIYSAAQITGTDVTLEAHASQAAVIDGGNSITLIDSTLKANHKRLYNQNTTHQAILICQSQPGSSSDDSSSFTMKNGSLTNTKGDVFCVTNTAATIMLEGVDIYNENSDGYFLRAASGKMGRSGKNGGKVILNARDQAIDGDILVDSISELTMTLSGNSEFNGAINTSGHAGTVKVTVASGSTWKLTSDSYVSSVINSGTIEHGEYILYVNGKAYSDESSKSGDDDYPYDTGIAPSITTTSLKNATAGELYSVTLNADGTKPITWESDSLPDGLSLNSLTGEISGTPEAAEECSITFTAINPTGSDSVIFDLNVNDVIPRISGTVKAGVKDEPYSTVFKTTAGTGPITWELDGDLPEGLSFDDETATLGGVPAEVWDDYITITARNTLQTVKKSKLVIKSVKPRITAKAIDPGIAGEEYSASVAVAGSKAIDISAEGLPEGLSPEFDSDEGVISIIGTPEKAGKYPVKITAVNSEGTTKKTINLVVNSEPDITSLTLEDGTTGKSYNKKLTASGTTPITWKLDEDSRLPVGLTLNSKGRIKGIPSSYGSSTFTVTAANEYGSDTADITININAAVPIISPKTLKKGTAGKAYSFALTAKNGAAPITWECSENLPAGLTFEDGVFSGTPTRAFSDTITVMATNAAGASSEMTYNLLIKAVAPKIENASLPSGRVGAYYSTNLSASEGTPEIVWGWANAPDGLDLDIYTGDIYGTPKFAGTYMVKITATNDLKSVSKNFPLTIAEAGTISVPSIEHSTKAESGVSVSGLSLPEGYEIVYELGEIKVDLSGMYDMELELDAGVKAGAKLFWLARAQSREASEDDTIAEFFSADGAEIREVPAARKIIASAWLEAGVSYRPVIAVK